MVDKRQYVRIPADKADVKLRFYKGETEYYHFGFSNISTGGLLLNTKEELKIGDKYLLTVETAETGNNSSIDWMARVKRVEKKEEGFETAFEFQWISSENIDSLKKILETFLWSHINSLYIYKYSQKKQGCTALLF